LWIGVGLGPEAVDRGLKFNRGERLFYFLRRRLHLQSAQLSRHYQQLPRLAKDTAREAPRTSWFDDDDLVEQKRICRYIQVSFGSGALRPGGRNVPAGGMVFAASDRDLAAAATAVRQNS
jgi:hypothetical protein